MPRVCSLIAKARLCSPSASRVLTLLPVHEAEFVECSSVGCMIGSEACLHEPLKLLCIELGGGVVAARVMILKGLFDRLDVGWLADAVASAPNVASARIATKAIVLLRRPAIMTFP